MNSNTNAIASTSQQQQQQNQQSSTNSNSNSSNTNSNSINNNNNLVTVISSGSGVEGDRVEGNNTSLEDKIYLPLLLAGKNLDEKLLKDERWIIIGDNLNNNNNNNNQSSSSSGGGDYILPPNPAWSPYKKTRTILLPDRLFEEHDLTQSRCSMGLLPEIERAWVTVDHRLLLWDWSDGSSFSTFEELNDVIVGVGIVKPKIGIFVDEINYILVLTTPNEIILVGLGYASPSNSNGVIKKKEITFYLTGLTVSTDGISLTNIKGTNSGRIFLTSSTEILIPGGIGGDGNLYELNYQSNESWFSKKITLKNLTSNSFSKSIVPTFLRNFSSSSNNMNEWIIQLEIDEERNLLYTLLKMVQLRCINYYQMVLLLLKKSLNLVIF